MLRGEEGAGEIDVERPLPDVELDPLHHVVAPDELGRRVRDDDVEAAPAGDGLAERGRDPRLVGDVRRQRQRIGAAGLDGRRERVLVDVEQGDASVLGGEAHGGGAADAARGSRDERALAREQPGHAALRALKRGKPCSSVKPWPPAPSRRV